MTIDLSEDEVRALTQTLRTYLVELRTDAARTEAHEAKQQMWQLEHHVANVLARLERQAAGEQTYV